MSTAIYRCRGCGYETRTVDKVSFRAICGVCKEEHAFTRQPTARPHRRHRMEFRRRVRERLVRLADRIANLAKHNSCDEADLVAAKRAEQAIRDLAARG